MNGEIMEKIADGIYLIKIPFDGIWTGCVLIRKPGCNMLIDSGANAAGVDDVIVPALGELGMSPADIHILTSTHTHGDHVGGHARLRELGVRQIAVIRSGLDKLRDPLKYNKAIRAVFPEYSAPPAVRLDGVEPDIVLDDQSDISGVEIHAFAGHDSDTVVFFDRASGTLISGDSIQGNGTATLGCALYMDLASYSASLEKILTLPIVQVVTGHPFFPWNTAVVPGKTAIVDSIALVQEYDRILNGMTDRPLPQLAEELIHAVGGSVPRYLFLAMYTVREHLRRNGDHEQ